MRGWIFGRNCFHRHIRPSLAHHNASALFGRDLCHISHWFRDLSPHSRFGLLPPNYSYQVNDAYLRERSPNSETRNSSFFLLDTTTAKY